MANKTQKKATKKQQSSETQVPVQDDAGAVTDYAQLQDDEVEALKAIYFDEFEEVEVKSAWNKSSDKAFRIKVKAFSEEDVYLILSVKFTATYPKTAPVVVVEQYHGIREKTQTAIASLLTSKVKEQLGNVMIFDLTSTIQDVLEDEVQHRADGEALPNLEEERAKQEAQMTRDVEAQQLEADKQVQRDKEEEDRHLLQMMEEEMLRRRQQRNRGKAPLLRKTTSVDEVASDRQAQPYIIFDRDVTFQQGSTDLTFNAVQGLTRYRSGPVTKVSTVVPVLGQANAEVPLLLVTKSCILRASSVSDKKRILGLEDALEKVKKMPTQANCMSLLEFKIDQKDANWHLTILSAYANKGNLGDLLAAFDVLPLPKLRLWTVDLLEAIEFLHGHGVTHGSVHLNNILLDQAENGSLTLKLADGGFQHILHDSESSPSRSQARSVYWQPPELLAKADKMRHSKREKKRHGQNLDGQSAEAYANARPSHGEGLSDGLSGVQQSDHAGATDSQMSAVSSNKYSAKTDIWATGIVFLQMLFGADTPDRYSSPIALLDRQDLTLPLQSMIRQMFASDAKKRPSPFDLIPSEFLRSEIPILRDDVDYAEDNDSASNLNHFNTRRRRSSLPHGQYSRYLNDWIETGRLGKGGFGEVVKARNKTDGHIYAIKKITSKMEDALSKILSEVMLLSRLNHPNVVRYYSAWPEEQYDESETDLQTSTTSGNTIQLLDQEAELTFGQSIGGLDFISSSGYPKIVFGHSGAEDDDEEVEDDTQQDTDNEDAIAASSDESDTTDTNQVNHKPHRVMENRVPLARRTRTTSTISGRLAVKTTLYIQMEYCERHTLRDLIRKGLQDNDDEIWRLLREVVEGLVHIHSHGIIHRDLKPDNIFIDMSNEPKIGDFGLATSGRFAATNQSASAGLAANTDMTRSIGTAFYVAPELKSDKSGQYNEKVDMYSLGIIFFEMCFSFATAMERAEIIGRLRTKDVILPTQFDNAANSEKCDIIRSLLSHRPAERPSSTELLRGGKIPFQIQDETVQQALRGLADPASPYYLKMMEALFKINPTRQIKDQIWDIEVQHTGSHNETAIPLMQMLVKEKLCEVFRRHGAVEIHRQTIFPRSPLYTNELVVEMLNPSGTLVQLPYDMTLPGARVLARNKPACDKTFAFGQVYRDTRGGSAPRANGAVDFDIVSETSLDPALKEAEVLKVVDEIVNVIPSLKMTQMCFHLNHSIILDVILDFCRISSAQRGSVKEVLSRLNIQDNTWIKVRNELRAPSFGIASTSLDDLARFDFRDSLDKTVTKLKTILGEAGFQERLQATFTHLQAVARYMRYYGVQSKTYICPLSCYNEKFYRGGILFQCLFDSKRREVLAAGGRYDSLIEDHRPRVGQTKFTGCRAVGISLGWDRLVSSMVKLQKGQAKSSAFLKRSARGLDDAQDQWPLRRCSVVVASFDFKVLRSAALKLLAMLWSNDISAELAADATSLEELTSRYRDEKHSWIVIIKNDPVIGRPDLRVKSLFSKQDTDISMDNLIAWLRAEIKDRDQREGQPDRSRLPHRPPPTSQGQSYDMAQGLAERQPNVQMLLAQHKGKKTNRGNVIEAAQSRVQEHLASYSNAPIAAVETTDALLEAVRTARLSDSESWRKVIQSAPANDRSYIQNIQSMLQEFRNDYLETGTSKAAFIFNFRTGWIGLYDLSL